MIYVMSDIHGMYDKYIEMMDLIDLKETVVLRQEKGLIKQINFKF